MNYFDFRKKILATIQINARLFSVLIDIDSDVSSAVVHLDTIRFESDIESASNVDVRALVRNTIRFKVERIKSESNVIVQDVSCPDVEPFKVEQITSSAMVAVQALVNNTEAINSIIHSFGSGEMVLDGIEPVAFKASTAPTVSLGATIDFWDDWVYFMSQIALKGNVNAKMVVPESVGVNASVLLPVGIEPEIKILDLNRISSIIDIDSNVAAVISLGRLARIEDYYEGTIEQNFYNKNIEDIGLYILS